MKLEVEIEDDIYHRAQEIFGDDVDLGVMMGEMLGAMILIMATHPEDFMAVFTRQASPEQRKRIDDAMELQTKRVLKKAQGKQ